MHPPHLLPLTIPAQPSPWASTSLNALSYFTEVIWLKDVFLNKPHILGEQTWGANIFYMSKKMNFQVCMKQKSHVQGKIMRAVYLWDWVANNTSNCCNRKFQNDQMVKLMCLGVEGAWSINLEFLAKREKVTREVLWASVVPKHFDPIYWHQLGSFPEFITRYSQFCYNVTYTFLNSPCCAKLCIRNYEAYGETRWRADN